jgi:hypothetical protein
VAGETVDGVAAIGYGAQQISIIPSAGLVVVHTGIDFEGQGADPADQIVRYVLPALGASR